MRKDLSLLFDPILFLVPQRQKQKCIKINAKKKTCIKQSQFLLLNDGRWNLI